MTTLEVLTAARALIAESENWCQGTYSLDENGKVRFCVAGAIMQVASETDAYLNSYAHLEKQARITLVKFNDTHTHAEVIGLLDTAIAELSG